jgi:hypothetical protein
MRTYQYNVNTPISFNWGHDCALFIESKRKTEVEYDVVRDEDEW